MTPIDTFGFGPDRLATRKDAITFAPCLGIYRTEVCALGSTCCMNNPQDRASAIHHRLMSGFKASYWYMGD